MSRRFAQIVNGKGGFVGKTALAAGAAIAIDGASEYLHIPVLNDESNFPGLAGHSNAEVILYGAGLLGTVLGGVSLLSKGGRVIGNVGAEVLPASLGLLLGTYGWENVLAPALIRNQPA